MKRNNFILLVVAAIAMTVAGLALSGETNIVVKTVLVRMLCGCGGEMKPTNIVYASYPAQYPHICDRCGTNATYTVRYPEIRYENAH